MQELLYMELLGCLSEKGFSLDELVIKVEEAISKDGAACVVKFLLMFFDETICRRLSTGEHFEWFTQCCESPKYEFHGKRKRQLRTQIKTIEIKWCRLRCVRCGSVVVPLRDLLVLEPYQRKTAQLERVVMETVSETAYRRATQQLDTIGHIPIPKSTSHRWVMESDCDEIAPVEEELQTLMPDGTGYKRRPDAAGEISNRGELKVVIGVNKSGDVVPFGAWGDSSWREIGEKIRNSAGSLPVAKQLMADGEPQLCEALAELVDDEGRCHWHMVHDLDYSMWKDKAPLNERRSAQGELAGILGIEVPAEDYHKISDEDRKEVEGKMAEAERKLDEFAATLSGMGYGTAANYVRNAQTKLFSHIRLWLKCGLMPTRTTSVIERLMRELGRRLKKIAFGWKPKGVEKIAKIILRRITDRQQWEQYWKQRLGLNNNVFIIMRGVKLAC